MNKWFFLIFLSTLVSGQTEQFTCPLKFLALGDSYTIGQSVAPDEKWPIQLSKQLQELGCSVDTTIIIAQTGWTTTNLSNAINAQELDTNFNLVSLLIGVNNQYQGKNIEDYPAAFESLLKKAIQFASGNPNNVMVLSIPDYAYTPYGETVADPSRISREIDAYNAINKEISNAYEVAYYNITPISRGGLANPSLVASDGLHPSGFQYARWVNLILGEGNSSTTAYSVMNNEKPLIIQKENQVTITFETSEKRVASIYNSSGILLQKIAFEQDLDIYIPKNGVYVLHLQSDHHQSTHKMAL